MTKISVAIIATDMGVVLPSCLASAKKLSDDVVIVTNADHQFINYSDQKNFAVSKCKYDWVFSLDADEEISTELSHELSTIDFDSRDEVAYKVPRLNIIFGKPIRHTNWEPEADTHIWFFRKSQCKWEGDVHEEVVASGRVGVLTGRKIHHHYNTVSEFIEKMNVYTSLETKAVNPIYDFLRRYIWHKGFLDGWHGFVLSYLMFIYHVSVWVKLRLKKSLV